MAEYQTTRTSSQSAGVNAAIDSGLRAHMNKVYGLMAVAMVITGAVAYSVGTSPALINAIFSNQILSLVIMFAPLGFVFFLSARIMSMTYSGAQFSFWLFAAVMGISLSSIFVVYTGASIANAFFTTSVAFAGLSLYGYTTKRDLSSFGRFLFMGVIGLIVAMIANWFLKSPGIEFAVNVLGVLIFAGLTAYDTQNIKNTYLTLRSTSGEQTAAKAGVLGALSLYINFLNMFLFLLSIFGNRN